MTSPVSKKEYVRSIILHMNGYLDYKSGQEEEYLIDIKSLGDAKLTVVLYGPEDTDYGFVQNSATTKFNSFSGVGEMIEAMAYQLDELKPKKTLKGHHPDLDYEWNEDLPSDVN